jgi:hypothetical protein
MNYRPSPNRPPTQTPRAWWGAPVSNGFALVLVALVLLALWALN